MLKTLVTGSGGLVGSAVKWLIEQEKQGDSPSSQHESWIFVTRRDADLRDREQAEALFRTHRPDRVIHLAAKVGGVFANSAHQADFLTENIAIDQNVLFLSHKYQVSIVVSCLSTCIFPDDASYPMDEDVLHQGPPHGSNFGYAYAKRLLDISNRAYNDQHGTMFTAIIPTNIYGPNDQFGAGCHFMPAMIQKVAAASAACTKSLTVAGSGKAFRQFVFSRDVAKVLLWMIRNRRDLNPLIVSTPEEQEVQIRDVVNMICELQGFEGDVQWDTSKTDGQLRKTVTPARLLKEYPLFEFTPLRTGLELTLQWYRETHVLKSKI